MSSRSRDDSDFTGNLVDWEERVFRNAMGFRLHRFYGQGGADRAQVLTFPEAVKMCQAELKRPGVRVMLYAVAQSGRWFLIPEKQWPHYQTVWADMQKEKANARTKSR